jgi:hypothetical protein
MRVNRIILWSGMIVSATLCLLALVSGALVVFNSVVVWRPELGSVYFRWWMSFAGTFITSVNFFILMFREGEPGH